MTTFDNILEQLEYLKLPQIREYLLGVQMNKPVDENTLEFVEKMLNSQVESKKKNTMMYNVKVAAFPSLKYLDDYDFDFQPTIAREQLDAVLASDIVANTQNVLFIGSPGVGKTHLSIALGIEIAKKRNAVYFIKFTRLIEQLRTFHCNGELERKIKAYKKYKVLIIDEIGFNEITALESKLFFQLIDDRYEKKSLIITSNVGLEKWDKIFGGDEMITRAIIDRLLHHSHMFNITGNSYRLKDKLVIATDES